MKISVVVCTYNYAHFLKDALRTLAAQTFPDFELLVVDDGSTDNTEQVVQQFSPQFRHCTYRKKPHTGLPDSRNYGVRAAPGSHIAFLDADDLWSPEYLEAMRGVFESVPEAELVCSDGLRIDDTGIVFGPLFPPGLASVCGPLRTTQELFSFFPYVLPSAMMFSKTAYERVGPFANFQSTNDWHWVIRAVRQGTFCVRLDRKLVFYRHHGANLTTQTSDWLEEWLSLYEDVRKGKQMHPEAELLARKITRRVFSGLLARCPAKPSRRLLQRAIQTHGKDGLLETAYWLTYFGLCPLAKTARRVKQILRKLSPPKMRIDLQAAPEKMFATISEELPKPEGMAGRKSAQTV